MEHSISTGAGPEENQNTQRRTLAELEEIVQTGLATYQAVGAALDEIHERKLYRELGFKNFRTYLKERWGISRAHGYRLISAAKVAQECLQNGDTPPKNEFNARKAPKEKRAKREPKAKQIEIPDDLEPDTEFEKFKSLVSVWQAEFAQNDYLALVGQVAAHVDDILSEAGYADDIVGGEPEKTEVEFV